jgi:hypothetical protein
MTTQLQIALQFSSLIKGFEPELVAQLKEKMGDEACEALAGLNNFALASKLVEAGVASDPAAAFPTVSLLNQLFEKGGIKAETNSPLPQQQTQPGLTGLDAFVDGLTQVLPKTPLSDRPWKWLFEKLVENPKDADLLAALMSKPEIITAINRSKGGKFALVKSGELDQEATEKNVNFLQNPMNTPKRRHPGGFKAATLQKALGIISKYVLHPVTKGETLDNGVDSDGLVWIGNDLNWPEDAVEAMFWASGLSGNGRHRLWRFDDSSYDVHDALTEGKSRFLTMIEDYQTAVEDEDLIVDMTVKGGGKPHVKEIFTQAEADAFEAQMQPMTMRQTPPTDFWSDGDGDVVNGDKVGGDKVGGDKISVGNVSGSGIAIGGNASASSGPTIDLSALNNAIRKAFNESEVFDICFSLGIDYESLPGDGKDNKVRELILFCNRTKTLPNLLAAVQRLRPMTRFQ